MSLTTINHGGFMKQNKKLFLFCKMVFAIACVSFLGVACQKVDETEILRSHIDEMLQDMTPVKTVTDVKMIIDDPNEAAKYTIVSARAPEHYAKGHVPGAINIPYKTIADDASLAQIDPLKPAIVYCYTGHTGQLADTILYLLGYESYNMKYGMMGWTDDPEVLGQQVFDCNPPNYETETTPNDLPADNELPVIETGAEEATAIVQARAQAYLGAVTSPVKTVTDVKMIIDDPTEAAKYTIVSVRSPEHYAKGHVPGAINIPYKDIAKLENLKKLPADKPIITYCYTGHTGQVACTVLNLLGYEAYNMKYGMMGWTDDSEILGQQVFDCNPPNYPVEK
jgi:rhodanese-related sulfurtransferase